jgi:hypothetical protein
VDYESVMAIQVYVDTMRTKCGKGERRSNMIQFETARSAAFPRRAPWELLSDFYWRRSAA